MNTQLKHSFVLASGAALLLVGCSKTEQLGPDADDGSVLHGQVTQAEVFSGVSGHSTTISAKHLKEGYNYYASGMLIIEGNVPKETKITVTDGKLKVTGSIGEGSVLRVTQPVVTHESAPYSCYKYGYDFLSGKFEYSMKINRCRDTVVDGLKYNDPAPAIEVQGKIAGDVVIATQGRVVVSGQERHNPQQLRHYLAPKADI